MAATRERTVDIRNQGSAGGFGVPRRVPWRYDAPGRTDGLPGSGLDEGIREVFPAAVESRIQQDNTYPWHIRCVVAAGLHRLKECAKCRARCFLRARQHSSLRQAIVCSIFIAAQREVLSMSH